ncbi:MAG: serine/threonine protein kinase, partial [Actinomycetota bacterium]|nr:serine/threonine protein kinase [Actinomycetota bacterium]
RTFTAGQRALLWAAGVLGTLAIIIAVLIVVNAKSPGGSLAPATVTDTGGAPVESSSPESHPEGPPAHSSGWTWHRTSQ